LVSLLFKVDSYVVEEKQFRTALKS